MAAEVRISVANLFQAAALIVAANIVFFLLLFVVDASINHRALHDRLVDAAAHGVINDQDYPPDIAIYSDRFTDCLALSLNLHDSPDRTALEMIRDTEIAKIEGIGACRVLMMMLANDNSVGTMNYGRYWHGYQIISKPFLRFGDVRNLRYVLGCIVIGAVFLFSTTVAAGFAGAAKGPLLGLWFALSYLLLTDAADLGNVFTHSVSLAAIFALPLFAFWAARSSARPPLLLVAVAIGCVNSFFDLLFNPPLGLSALIVATAAALSDEDPPAREIWRMIAVVSFGWAIGFFGTYICRFAIAVLLSTTPMETLRQIFTAGLFRLSGMEEKIEPVMFWATIKNFGYPMLRPSFAVFAIVSAALVIALPLRGYRFTPRPVLAALVAPSFISVIWFEIFRNHSQHHHWFTYRSASFALVCLAAAVIFCFSRQTQPELENSGSQRYSVV